MQRVVHVHRIYAPVQPRVGLVNLRGDIAHRFVNVLRLHIGDEFVVTDGKGNEMRARLIKAHRREAVAEIYEVSQPLREPSMRICLAVALLKGERFEWVIQKATELGVGEILPLLTRNTVVRISQDELPRKLKRWLSIAISAMEQCGGCLLPIVHEPTPLSEALLKLMHFNVRIMLHERAEQSLFQAVSKLRNVESASLLIGPEGGFDEAEIEEAISHGAIVASLSRRILRAETAAIVGAAILLHCLEPPSAL